MNPRDYQSLFNIVLVALLLLRVCFKKKYFLNSCIPVAIVNVMLWFVFLFVNYILCVIFFANQLRYPYLYCVLPSYCVAAEQNEIIMHTTEQHNHSQTLYISFDANICVCSLFMLLNLYLNG